MLLRLYLSLIFIGGTQLERSITLKTFKETSTHSCLTRYNRGVHGRGSRVPYILFTGWEVRRVENCNRGFENAAQRCRPRNSKVTVFHYTDRHYTTAIFFSLSLKSLLEKSRKLYREHRWESREPITLQDS